MTRLAYRLIALTTGSLLTLVAGPAQAQQPLACPPCGPNAHCDNGVCLPGAEVPPVPPPVQEAAPPTDAAPAAVPPPVEAAPPPIEAVPAPRPTSRRKPRVAPAAKRDQDDEQEVEVKAPAAPRLVPWRRGMLVMPFAGFHAVEGIAANDYDAGLRIGGLVGAHVAPAVSLNLELAMNFLSPKNETGSARNTPSGHDLTIAFSPLFHGAAGPAEFVVGPKIGFWSSSLSADGTGDQASQTGWAFGFNMGAFGGLSDDLALGAIVAYQMTFLSQTCTRSPDPNLTGCNSTGFPPQILSFAVAALF